MADHLYAIWLDLRGRLDEVEVQMRGALEVDPVLIYRDDG
jgi:hypothetical protein